MKYAVLRVCCQNEDTKECVGKNRPYEYSAEHQREGSQAQSKEKSGQKIPQA